MKGYTEKFIKLCKFATSLRNINHTVFKYKGTKEIWQASLNALDHPYQGCYLSFNVTATALSQGWGITLNKEGVELIKLRLGHTSLDVAFTDYSMHNKINPHNLLNKGVWGRFLIGVMRKYNRAVDDLPHSFLAQLQ